MWCYITVLHHVRRLEPIWICAIQMLFWRIDWNSSGRVLRPGESLDQESLHAVWHHSVCAFLMFKIVSQSSRGEDRNWVKNCCVYFFYSIHSCQLLWWGSHLDPQSYPGSPSRSPKLPWFSIKIPSYLGSTSRSPKLPWFSIKLPNFPIKLPNFPIYFPKVTPTFLSNFPNFLSFPIKFPKVSQFPHQS